MPLEIEPITSAPSSASQTEPRPPNRLVPAMTGPAIASSSRSLPPEDWLTASRREAARMPPAAASVEREHEHDHADARDAGCRRGAPPRRCRRPRRRGGRRPCASVTNDEDRAEADEDQPGERDAAVGVAARATAAIVPAATSDQPDDEAASATAAARPARAAAQRVRASPTAA